MHGLDFTYRDPERGWDRSKVKGVSSIRFDMWWITAVASKLFSSRYSYLIAVLVYRVWCKDLQCRQQQGEVCRGLRYRCNCYAPVVVNTMHEPTL